MMRKKRCLENIISRFSARGLMGRVSRCAVVEAPFSFRGREREGIHFGSEENVDKANQLTLGGDGILRDPPFRYLAV